MVSVADSQATFKARLVSLGAPDNVVEALIKEGVDTLAKLAWIVGLAPGSKEADDAYVKHLQDLAGTPDPLNAGVLATMRRAWAEAHTLWVADMRQRVERPSESQPRKLPHPERGARSDDQKKRLRGMTIEGVYEPSHSLIDAVAQMKDDDCLRYLELSACTSRPQELQNIKKDPVMKLSASGVLTASTAESEQKADLSSEYRVRVAMQRRALAFDQFSLLPFEDMENWHNHIFELLQRTAPPGHGALSLDQILRADKQLWVTFGQLTSKGISRRGDGSYPIGDAMSLARSDPMVVAVLQPLPQHDSVPVVQKRAAENGLPQPPAKVAKGYTKGSGKSKGKRPRFTVRLPEPLRGYNTKSPQGQNLCFSFNLASGCTGATAGKACPKGLHACMKCYGHHALTACPKK